MIHSPIKASWRDVPLTLRDLAKTLCPNKAKNTIGAFSASPEQDLLPHANTTHLATIKVLQTAKITKLGLLPLSIWFLTEGSQY